ncbi:MAG: 2-oxo acid dehydrogenase subunit E2 [Deltaproteobacteria bacterium]|nr:2-oxo acid dehydrogenase subunit E2 [Deltaproteobacteria bacterium]
MTIDVVMPKLSDTMEEGKILRWLKRAGDGITAGEVIAEVETDKADMELEAADSGVLHAIRVQEGETAAVGAVLAVIDVAGAGRAAAPPAAGEPPAPAPAAAARPTSVATGRGAGASALAGRKPAAPVRTERPSSGRRAAKASPAAEALARERGVDLGSLRGSGPGGRIVTEDVAAAAPDAPAAAVAPPAVRRPGAPREAAVAERRELSRMRQAIARRMSESFRDVPHFAVTAEIDMSEAVRLKAALEKEAVFEAPVTYTHMVLKAAARALARHPRLNASYRDGAIELHAEVNLGMAVSVEDGLIVPVLRRADERSLGEIASEARRLVALAKQGRFASEDLSGGTCTVSNMGMLDVESFTAVINPPQAAILAVGAIKQRPVVRAGVVAAAHTMFVTVSCDHRIVDGVMAGRFLEELKRLLEQPIGLAVA